MTSCQVENDRPESETDGACTGTTSAPVARTGVKIMTPGAAGLRLGAGPAMGEMTPRGDGATGTGAVTTVGVMLTVGVNTNERPYPWSRRRLARTIAARRRFGDPGHRSDHSVEIEAVAPHPGTAASAGTKR